MGRDLKDYGDAGGINDEGAKLLGEVIRRTYSKNVAVVFMDIHGNHFAEMYWGGTPEEYITDATKKARLSLEKRTDTIEFSKQGILPNGFGEAYSACEGAIFQKHLIPFVISVSGLAQEKNHKLAEEIIKEFFKEFDVMDLQSFPSSDLEVKVACPKCGKIHVLHIIKNMDIRDDMSCSSTECNGWKFRIIRNIIEINLVPHKCKCRKPKDPEQVNICPQLKKACKKRP